MRQDDAAAHDRRARRRPSVGTITVDGGAPDAARAAKRIGFVPQSPALLPWRTVEANVRLLQDVNRAANPAELPDPARR